MMSDCEYSHEDMCTLEIMIGKLYKKKHPCKYAIKESKDSPLWQCGNYDNLDLSD
jgi:hypothetical protein